MRLSAELAKVRSRAPGEAVAFDHVVPAVPEPDRVAAHALLQVLAGDAVADDTRAIDLFEMDAEQRVFNHVALDAVIVAFEQDAGIDAVVQFAAAADVQAAQRYAVGGNREHRAASGAEDGYLAATIKRQRPGDRRRPGIGPRRQAQNAAGRRGVDQLLQGRRQ
jgi:hypothetical protein